MSIRADLVVALRSWRHRPAATATAILALALGIGASATVFGFISGVLLRPLPFADPGRLVMMWQDRSARGGPAREVISPGLFIDWSQRASAIHGVTALVAWSPTITGAGADGVDEPERLDGATVSAAFFDTLGVAPALGRTFEPADDVPGAPAVVVISDALHQRRFGGTPDIVGRAISIDGRPAQVIGVMPRGFKGAVIDAEIWNTMRVDPADAPRGLVMLRAFGRLAPGMSLADAQASMDVLQSQLQREDDELVGQRARLVPLQDEITGGVRRPLMILGAGVGMVLLIACANVASLLLARAFERRSEMAVRVALGADRRRLIKQMLVESGAIAAAGAVLGALIAVAGIALLKSNAPPDAPRLDQVRFDPATLTFTVAASALATLAAGLFPALNASRAAVVDGLREGGRADTRATRRLRRSIVAAEVMAAMTLLAGAGLFVESFVNLQRVNLGFQPDGLLTASLVPPRARYPSRDAVRELIDAAVTRAAAIPGAADAAFTTMLPLSGGQIMFSFRIYGRSPAANPRDAPVGAYRAVSTNYFETMGMTITSGRAFTPDDRPGGAAVAVVNEAMVRKYWPGESPVGARIGLNGVETTVVGVVGDVHHKGPGIAPDPEMFVPYGQASVRQGWIVVRTTADPASLGGALRAAVRDADPNLPLASVRTMASRAADATAEPRFLATLLSSFSLVAVALALVGVYGLLSFTVTQRAREIGVRMAVGATAASVMRMVLVESVLVSAAGAAAGAVCAAWLSRLVRAQLFGVAPGDPTTLFLLFAALLAAAAAASLRPARRAATIDPVVAMRNDHLRSQ